MSPNEPANSVAAADAPAPTEHAPDIAPLVAIMARLRDPDTGCPWDVQQDFASIAPYTIEEAYEVADAIARADMAALKDELGDLLLQVIYHSRMAEEAGAFALNDVIAAICAKMVRRHPHVFGAKESGERETSPGWEEIKAAERAETHRETHRSGPGSAQDGGDAGALAGVALALPALLRAEKLQKRAARTGFDWPDTEGVLDKIVEEAGEVRAAASQDEREEEVGDLLFALVNLARHMKVDAEQALRRTNAKFERRFRAMEAEAGAAFAGLDLEAKEELWQRAKAAGL